MSINLSSLVLKSGTPTPSKVPGVFLEKAVVDENGVYVYFNAPLTETDLKKRWANSKTRSNLIKGYKITIFYSPNVVTYEDYNLNSVKDLFSSNMMFKHETISMSDCLSSVTNSITQKEYEDELNKLKKISPHNMDNVIYLLPFKRYIPFSNEEQKRNFSVVIVPHLINIDNGTKLSIKPELYGDYIVENILVNGHTPRERTIYKETGTQGTKIVQNAVVGRIWPRPSAIHAHNGKMMTGYYHTRRPHTELSMETVKDLKIINRKFISDMFKKHEPFSLPKENEPNTIMRGSNTDLSTKNFMKKLNGSTDTNGYYRCVFYFNFLEFVKDNLPYSYLLKNLSDLQIESLLKNMSEITIEISKYDVGAYKGKINENKKTILVSGKLTKTGDLIKDTNANVQEMNLNLNNKKFNFPYIRHFALTDFHHAEAALGTYAYSVDIRCNISKPWLKMLNKHLTTLNNGFLKTSKEYESFLKNDYFPKNDINIITHPEVNNISEEKRKMKAATTSLIDILDLLSYHGVTEDERNNYIAEFDKYLDEKYIDVENISYLANMAISEVSKKLSDVVLSLAGSNNTLGQSAVNLSSFSGGGTSTLSLDVKNKGQTVTGVGVKKIFGEKDFLERVIKSSNNATGIRYMPIISNVSTVGPNRINLNNLNTRMQNEFNKYFQDSQFLNEVIDMTKNKFNNSLNLNTSRYSYLTPIDISFPETKDVSVNVNNIKDVFNLMTRFNKFLIEMQKFRDPDLGNRPQVPIPYDIDKDMDIEKHKTAFNLLNYLSQNSSVQNMGTNSITAFMGEDKASSMRPIDPDERRESNGKFKEDVEGQNEDIDFFNRLKNKSTQKIYMKTYTEQMYNLLMPIFETEIYGKLFPLFNKTIPYGNNLLTNESITYDEIQELPMQVMALINIMTQRDEEQDSNRISFQLFKKFEENRNEVAGLLFMNFINLMQIEVLTGYKQDINGKTTNTPVYEVLTSETFSNLSQASNPTLCRMRQYTNKKFDIDSKVQQDIEVGNKLLPIFPLYDEVFLVERATTANISTPSPTTTGTTGTTTTTSTTVSPSTSPSPSVSPADGGGGSGGGGMGGGGGGGY